MNDNMICAIPARAGSKRLPGKNIKVLAGKPMIAYSIEAALASGCFDEVYVCTEDAKIAEIAKKFGAKVPILVPPEITVDDAASHDPCRYMAQHLNEKGRKFDTLMCLQPSSPLRSAGDIKASVEKFNKGGLDFLASVTPIDPHYFHWAMREKDGKWGMWFGEEYQKERTLLPPVMRPNGSIKIGKIGPLTKVGHFFGDNLGVIETPEERSIHVATEFDFNVCEFLLTRKNK